VELWWSGSWGNIPGGSTFGKPASGGWLGASGKIIESESRHNEPVTRAREVRGEDDRIPQSPTNPSTTTHHET
jgi:hypothetical protein